MSLILLATCADAATLNVPEDYTTIQAAVNAAAAGDTIRVSSGTYYENVNVNKALTLQGVDSGSGLPVVDARKLGNAITLSANNCILQDFVASNSSIVSSGIRVSSRYNAISGNIANDNAYGISLISSSNRNTISGNTATGNKYGIYLYSSSGNTISGNTATGNVQGIYLYSSSGNTISGNTATGNSIGIQISSSSSSNTISDNSATGNSQYGIYISASSSNTIYLNTFNSGWSNSANAWNSTTKIAHRCSSTYVGNRWSSYSGLDSDGNGIGDTPYSIPGGSEKDLYPITDNYAHRTHTVCASGCGYTTIQAAINAACPGDTIEVRSGNYYNYKKVKVNKSLTLRGVDSGSGLPVVMTIPSGSDSAISLTANNCTLQDFVAISSWAGIEVASSYNTITGNTATYNILGIYLRSSSGNTISGNTVTGNAYYGIYIDSSSGNTICLNTFNNPHNAWSTWANNWNSTHSSAWMHNERNLTGLLGNIWSDYNGTDCDGDGMGDTPYLIAGGADKDYHPIGGVLCSPGLEAEKIADRSEAEVGEWINYAVQVNNTGNVRLTGVRAEDNLTGAVWDVGTLAPGQNYTNTTRYGVNPSDLPGPLTNELRANGTDPCGGEVNASAIKTVNITNQMLLCINGTKTINCTCEGLANWTIELKLTPAR
ncbi:MAG: right-handed parallel beta-helix repeat-containing protein [Methanothrix sp.]